MGGKVDIIYALGHGAIILQHKADTWSAHNTTSQVHQAETVHVVALVIAWLEMGSSLTAADVHSRHCFQG